MAPSRRSTVRAKRGPRSLLTELPRLLPPITLAVALIAVAIGLVGVADPLPTDQASAAQPGVVTDLTWGASAAEQNRTAAVLQDVGSRWVRLSMTWGDTEPRPGRFNTRVLRQYDEAVARARRARQRTVIMLYTTPNWASGSSDVNAPPQDPAKFARFVRFIAKRYSHERVAAYEIWNEQNIARFWKPAPDPAAYTALLRAAYPAVKGADPDAKVVFGGLSSNDYDYVERAYAAGAKGSFDVMAVHPYTCAVAPEVVRRTFNGRVRAEYFSAYREVRASMLAAGDHKPIWFTEFGWSTSSRGCGVSEKTQADYLTRAVRLLEGDPYVQVVLWYNLRNNFSQRDADEPEARFGLLRTDFSPKPAFAAFKSLTAADGRPCSHRRCRSRRVP